MSYSTVYGEEGQQTFAALFNRYCQLMPLERRLTYPVFIRAVKNIGGPEKCEEDADILRADILYKAVHPSW